MFGFKKEIKSLLKTVTLKQSAVVFNSSLINGVLGAFFYIFLARFLGPSDFGFFIITVSALTLIADIADFGTNTGLVRFVSTYLESDKEKAYRFLKLSLMIKLVVWIVVVVSGFLLAPYVADVIFNKKELTGSLRLAMFGVGGALLFSFATSTLQAFQKFFTWGAINIFSNSFRLLLIFFLIFSGQLSLQTGLVTYMLLPFLGFFVALFFLPTKSFIMVSGGSKVTGQFLTYNRWVAVSTIFAAFSSRLDTFLSIRLLSTAEVGFYGAANQLTVVIPQLVGALGLVAAPKFASFTNIEQMLEFFKKLQILVIALAILGLLAIPFAYFLIPIILGTGYSAAVVPFIILFIAMLVFLIAVPVHTSIFYYFSRPDFFAWLSFVNLLVIAILGFVLISHFGIVGAAFTVLISMILNLLISLKWFLNKISVKV